MALLNWEKVDRSDPAYKACVTVSTAAGAIVGGATTAPLGALPGVLGGAAWGLAAGYVLCPFIVPAVRRKLEDGSAFTDAEVRAAAEGLGRYAALSQASDAVSLLGILRVYATREGSVPACRSPVNAARQILHFA